MSNGNEPIIATWPQNGWPQDCPPEDANGMNVTVYRAVKKDPPTPDDFQTYRELGKIVNRTRQCDACGLSVHMSEKDAVHYRSVFPSQGEFIAEGFLNATHGKLKATPSGRSPSHMTWWSYEGVIRHIIF